MGEMSSEQGVTDAYTGNNSLTKSITPLSFHTDDNVLHVCVCR